ncbi:hypothetical protein ASZ90_000678 [hydrocarbon metagenome]|uniref:Uncharacterized protein n=1 Tax=hydrocarbon metagenome TaxID=938273 RepID=A0A0W8G8G7_9ZZZZ
MVAKPEGPEWTKPHEWQPLLWNRAEPYGIGPPAKDPGGPCPARPFPACRAA